MHGCVYGGGAAHPQCLGLCGEWILFTVTGNEPMFVFKHSYLAVTLSS